MDQGSGHAGSRGVDFQGMFPSHLRRRRVAPFLSRHVVFVLGMLASIALADSTGVERLEPDAAQDVEDDPPRTMRATAQGLRLEAQGGVLRWKWNEVVPNRAPLEELGFLPVGKLEGIWIEGPVRLGASVVFLSGAIAYQGYLQDPDDYSVTPYESNTHYLAATPKLWVQWRSRGSAGWLRPSLSLSRPWWRRTLDGTRDRVPGPHGYIETWSVLTAGTGLEVGRGIGAASELALSGELLWPISTHESIGPKGSPLELVPGTRRGIRLVARGVHRDRYVGELEFHAVRFEESDPVSVTRGEKVTYYLQPESSLETVSLRIGRIF